jgi:soluble lytic murein transglycosylase-like protein
MLAALVAAALLAAGYGAPATATAPATRGTAVQVTDTPPPPPPAPPAPAGYSTDSAGGRCIGAEPTLTALSPGWDVARMSRIMYRESRCLPWARNPSGAAGLLQVMPAHCRWLAATIGPCDLFDPGYNVRAAAALWARDGYRPWNL